MNWEILTLLGPILLVTFSIDSVARSIGRVADEMKATRDEQKRQHDLDRQFPRKP